MLLTETSRRHDPAWYVPLRARKAHWFDGGPYSACRYYPDEDRCRLAGLTEQRCRACEKASE